MKRWISAATLVGCAALSAGVLANPMWISMSNGVQVPESMHVQVTAMIDSSLSGEDDQPLYVMQGDRRLEFVSGDFSFTENTGSGLATVSAKQVCDCDLKPGSYVYHFVYAEGVDTFGTVSDVTVTVVSPPPEAQEPEPMPEGEEVDPWDIPSPPWPKGVDCVEVCKNVVPVEPVADSIEDVVTLPDTQESDATPVEVISPADAPAPRQDVTEVSSQDATNHLDATGTLTDSNSSQDSSKEENKGCAASGASAAPLASALLFASLMGLLLVARRRFK